MEDRALLLAYTENHSEAAFAELVSRHVNMVYSTALRMVEDSHLAKDVAQTVFIGLARKPQAIRDPGALGSWLYRATHHAALQALRTENRRRHRETEAMNRALLDENSPSAWAAMSPLLDDALGQLKPVELDIVVLRFFEGKSLQEAGAALALTENAAQKRVTRALEKLRTYFAQRGVTASAALLATLMASHSAQAAPPGLAVSLASSSLAGAGGAKMAGSLAKTFTMTAKTKMIIAAAVIVAASAVPLTLQFQQIGGLDDKLAMEERKTKSDALRIARDEQEIQRLQNMVNQFQPSGGGVGGAASSNGGEAAGKPSVLAKFLTELMSDPAMREMLSTSAKQDAAKEFADIIKHFNLNPAERDQFLLLIMDRDMSRMDPALKLMNSPDLSPDDRAAIAQEVKDAETLSDSRIKQFLNSDADYAYFQAYYQQKPERGELDDLNASLVKTGQPLNPDQIDAMANLMYGERVNFNFSQNLSNGIAALDPKELTDDVIAKHLQETQQLQSQIAEKAAAVLSPEQLEAFKQHQAQVLESDKAGYIMARKVLSGGGSESTSPASP